MDNATAGFSAIFGSLVDDIRDELNELKRSNTSLLKMVESLEASEKQTKLQLGDHEEQMAQLSISLDEARRENDALRHRVCGSELSGEARSQKRSEQQLQERPQPPVSKAPDASDFVADKTLAPIDEATEPTEYFSCRKLSQEDSVASSATFCIPSQPRERRLKRHSPLRHSTLARTEPEQSQNTASFPILKKRKINSSISELTNMRSSALELLKNATQVQSGGHNSSEQRSHAASSVTVEEDSASDNIVVATTRAGPRPMSISTHGSAAAHVLENFDSDSSAQMGSQPQCTKETAIAKQDLYTLEHPTPARTALLTQFEARTSDMQRSGTMNAEVDSNVEENVRFTRDNGRLRRQPQGIRRAMGEVDWRNMPEI